MKCMKAACGRVQKTYFVNIAFAIAASLIIGYSATGATRNI